MTTEVKLPMPVVCECGFSTMDAKKAVDHARMHEVKATLETYRKLLTDGAIADLKVVRKAHTCTRCHLTIEKKSRHYCVYRGNGLGALKFPERYHVECMEE